MIFDEVDQKQLLKLMQKKFWQSGKATYLQRALAGAIPRFSPNVAIPKS